MKSILGSALVPVSLLAVLTAAMFVAGCGSGGAPGAAPAPAGGAPGAPLEPGRPVLQPTPTVPGLKFPLGGAAPTPMNAVIAYRNLRWTQPLLLTYPPDGTDRIFVVEQPGRIWVSPNDEFTTTKTLFLDISAQVNNLGNEEGLLGLAFDPDYRTNRYFYVYYSYRPSTTRFSRLSRFEVLANDPSRADPNSELVLLTETQPFSNHNGGMLAFGPDGYLYISLGDGGSARDPQGHGQNLATALGSILRIDVHGQTGNLRYRIPDDNPFVNTPGARGEIWAYGLRNPWRFSFDRKDGTLWCGDVGQNVREEIDIIVRGGNYGWSFREGFIAHQGTPPPGFQEIKPVVDYARTLGVSVTGGYVYRGSKVPELLGTYLYADYGSGRIWGLVYRNGQVISNTEIASVSNVTSFGEDRDGEVYAVSRGGAIYALTPRSPGNDPPFPTLLSQTGLFDDTATLTANPHLMPFDVAEPEWADDAVESRWYALPRGGQIGFDPTAAWALPVGAVLVQHFELPTTYRDLSTRTRLETRVLLHERDGWAGYVYRWNARQDDAELLPGPDTRQVTVKDPTAPNGARTQTWHFPARASCLSCHTTQAGTVLGFSTRQLNHRIRYAQRAVENQLEVYDNLGLFARPIGPAQQYDAFHSSRHGAWPLDQRARTWLAVNCAHCHRPGGTGGGNLDLRAETPLLQTGMRDGIPQSGTLGLPNARIVAPGNKASSVLWERLRRLDGDRMPPLGSHRVDAAAVELVGAWIDQLK